MTGPLPRSRRSKRTSTAITAFFNSPTRTVLNQWRKHRNELTHSTNGYLFTIGGEGTHKGQSYPTIRNAVCTRQKSLNSSYLKTGPQTDAHPKETKGTFPPRAVFDKTSEPDRRRDATSQRDAFSAQHREMPSTLQQTRPSRHRAVPSISCRSREGLLFPTTRLPIGRGVLTRLVAASRLDEGARVVLALRSLAGASS